MTDPVRIPILDDSPGSLAMLPAALRQDGAKIFTSEDPEEAVDIVLALCHRACPSCIPERRGPRTYL